MGGGTARPGLPENVLPFEPGLPNPYPSQGFYNRTKGSVPSSVGENTSYRLGTRESPRWLGHVQTLSPGVWTGVSRLAGRLVSQGTRRGLVSLLHLPKPQVLAAAPSGFGSCPAWGGSGRPQEVQSGTGAAGGLAWKERPGGDPLQWRAAPRGWQVQERRGGAEPGRVPDSQASRSDLPPPR